MLHSTIRTTALTAAIAFAPAFAGAQTQLVRGDIDAVQGTNNRFVLECTANVELVSNVVNLQALHDASRQQDIEYEMQVVDVSTGGRTILQVESATPIPEMLDMGNLRFGRSESWEVFAPNGADVFVFVEARSATSYLPLRRAGTWVLGTNAQLLQQGVSFGGSFRFQFTMPQVPGLVGTEFSSQAAVVQGGALTVTNPDCKEVRN